MVAFYSVTACTGRHHLVEPCEDYAYACGGYTAAGQMEHAFAYMVLALCLAGDSYSARLSGRSIYLLAIVLPVIYGGLIELIQPYFPPRTCEWGDWLADCIGATIGILIFGIFHICVIRRKQTRQASDKQ